MNSRLLDNMYRLIGESRLSRLHEQCFIAYYLPMFSLIRESHYSIEEWQYCLEYIMSKNVGKLHSVNEGKAILREWVKS